MTNATKEPERRFPPLSAQARALLRALTEPDAPVVKRQSQPTEREKVK